MTARRFTVNVPNPSDGTVAPTLTLEPVTEAELTTFGYDIPLGRLKIRSTRMTTTAPASTLAGCVDGLWMLILALISWLIGRPIQAQPLTVRLDPQTGADVHVTIDAVGSNGVAAMHLVDRRGGEIVGGVTLLVGGNSINVSTTPSEARNPCPLTLGEAPFWLPPGDEPDATRPAGPIPSGYDVDLVAWITNETEASLGDTTAYLEHLDGADAEFRPAIWSLGSFEPGSRFPLRWRVRGGNRAAGDWYPSIVVAAKGYDPIRLRPTITFGELARVEAVPAIEAGAEPA
jgi:hypothetical protein